MPTCWYCDKKIEGYVFRISGNDCDITCANMQVTRARDILGKLLSESDAFIGFGLGFEKPEFFWYLFIENRETVDFLKGELGAAQFGFSVYPLITGMPQDGNPEMIPAVPEQSIQGGTSIGHPLAETTGTIGSVLRIFDKRFVISTATVLAPEGAKLGDLIVHPSRPDSPKRGKILGKLAVISRMAPNALNDLDAAIVELQQEIESTPRIKNLGRPGDVSEPHIGMSMRKVGRTTSFTEGKVLCTDVRIKCFLNNRFYYLNDQFIISSENHSFADRGDEGSFVLDNRNAVIGMITLTFHGMAICSRATTLLERFGFVNPDCFEPLEDEI